MHVIVVFKFMGVSYADEAAWDSCAFEAGTVFYLSSSHDRPVAGGWHRKHFWPTGDIARGTSTVSFSLLSGPWLLRCYLVLVLTDVRGFLCNLRYSCSLQIKGMDVTLELEIGLPDQAFVKVASLIPMTPATVGMAGRGWKIWPEFKAVNK